MWMFKKLSLLFFSIFLVTTLTFFLMHAAPGEPFSQEQQIPQEILESMKAHYGLDQPLFTQYGRFLYKAIHFDFGPSFKYEGRTVSSIILNGFPISFLLGLEALILALCGGIAIGSFSARHHGSWLDTGSMILAILCISTPSFILATFLQYLFAMKLNLLPIARMTSFAHTILPACAIASMPMAFIARLTRSKMVEVLSCDYILTARSKGLTPFQILRRHVLKNSFLPILTYLGPLSAQVLTGSFIVEKIFGIPGLGHWFVGSIANRDYTVIMGLTIFYSTFLLFVMYFIDLIYPLIDPRIQLKDAR
jgi:oligopeptide transport system permease protein